MNMWDIYGQWKFLAVWQVQTKMKLRFYLTTIKVFIIKKKEQPLLKSVQGKEAAKEL